MSEWSPTEAWLDTRFDLTVKTEVFHDAAREERPVAVILGAQPGAGKTRAALFATELHSGRRLAVINGDDFRALHPDFKRLQRESSLEMPVVTQAVSGPLIKRSVEFARTERISVLLEGTFRDAGMVSNTARAFSEAGFEVHIVALAVPAQLSKASTLSRYVESLGTDQNRWTPTSSHDAAVEGMPATVEALARSEFVDRLTVLSRDGAVLSDSDTPGDLRATQMSEHVRHHLSRPLDEAEVDTVVKAAIVIDQAIDNRSSLGSSVANEAALKAVVVARDSLALLSPDLLSAVEAARIAGEAFPRRGSSTKTKAGSGEVPFQDRSRASGRNELGRG